MNAWGWEGMTVIGPPTRTSSTVNELWFLSFGYHLLLFIQALLKLSLTIRQEPPKTRENDDENDEQPRLFHTLLP